MKEKKGLYKKMIIYSILPVCVLGIIITVICIDKFTKTMYADAEKELKDIAVIVSNTYDMMYRGDYIVEEKNGSVNILKGKTKINGNTEYIDCLKEETGVDITVFYYNTRILTTLFSDGKRMTGTYASTIVEKNVLEKGKECFYNNVYVGNQEYFAYYEPLFNSDGSCIGMIFTGKPSKEMKNTIINNIISIIIISVGVIILFALLGLYYTRKIVKIVLKIQKFMENVSKGELNSDMSEDVLNSKDEFALIAESAVEMQNSLKTLVELDALTKINNRHCGEKKLSKLFSTSRQTGVPFCLVIGDIDYFKKVNDTYGHECGDKVLKEVANVLKKKMVGKGFAARWGGEEFLLAFNNMNRNEAHGYVEKILEEIRNLKVQYDNYDIKVTMTFGIAQGNAEQKEHLIIKEADDNLYKGKTEGRNRVV